MDKRIRVHPFIYAYALVPFLAVLSVILFPDRAAVTAILAATTFAWWTVVVWYHLRSKWFKNPYGRNAMGIDFGLAALHTVFLASVSFGRYPGYLIVYTLAFLNLGIFAVQRIRFIEKAQKGL